MSKKTSMLTDVALDVAKIMDELVKDLKDIAPEPFMKKRVTKEQAGKENIQWQQRRPGG